MQQSTLIIVDTLSTAAIIDTSSIKEKPKDFIPVFNEVIFQCLYSKTLPWK